LTKNGTRPFQTVLTRIRQCCNYAADSDQPYTDKQILAKLHAIVFHTGLYHEALEKWDDLPAVQKTFDMCSKHIMHAQNNLQNKEQASSTAMEWRSSKCRSSPKTLQTRSSTIGRKRKRDQPLPHHAQQDCRAKIHHSQSSNNNQHQRIQHEIVFLSLIMEAIAGRMGIAWHPNTQAKHVEPKNLATRMKLPIQTHSMDHRLERLKRDKV
jgi:hypothetical protein